MSCSGGFGFACFKPPLAVFYPFILPFLALSNLLPVVSYSATEEPWKYSKSETMLPDCVVVCGAHTGTPAYMPLPVDRSLCPVACPSPVVLMDTAPTTSPPLTVSSLTMPQADNVTLLF